MGTPTPKRGEAITIHFTGPDGKSYATVMQFLGWTVKGDSVALFGLHRSTGELRGIDNRIDNQKAAIDRLLDHLRAHCPELNSGLPCSHVKREETS